MGHQQGIFIALGGCAKETSCRHSSFAWVNWFLVDHVLHFGGASSSNCRELNQVLQEYGQISGQQFNPWVPIFRGVPRKIHLQSLADRIIKKFAKWKDASLSMIIIAPHTVDERVWTRSLVVLLLLRWHIDIYPSPYLR